MLPVNRLPISSSSCRQPGAGPFGCRADIQRRGALEKVFIGEKNRHGSAYKVCWGYRIDCSSSRIGQYAEALDQSF